MNLAEGDDIADLLLISFAAITALMMVLTRIEHWMSQPRHETQHLNETTDPDLIEP